MKAAKVNFRAFPRRRRGEDTEQGRKAGMGTVGTSDKILTGLFIVSGAIMTFFILLQARAAA